MIIIVVAYDSNRVIGFNGSLPWYLPEDLKHFKNLTTGHSVILGRKTWDSLPKKPLRGRLNIVLTNGFLEIPSEHRVANDTRICVAGNLEDAIATAERERPQKDVFIIGGAQVYESALREDVVDTIFVSKVPGQHEGDVFFPELSTDDWECVYGEKKEGFTILRYEKKKN